MLVKLQKRSQQGTSEHSYQSTAAILLVCLSTSLPGVIGIIVRLELRTKLGVPLASMGRVIKGTCFWRSSRGHITCEHVGATARLIKWLPLISTMHMKGLCLLHDRFYASSPWDLPRYTRTEAGRKTMYHMYSLILTLSTDVCVCVCVLVYIYVQTYLSSLKENTE